jgi:hypothetical protein
VFVVPAREFKSRRAHVVILNDAAWSIIETQRDKHPVWVFPYRGKRVNGMNNTAWQRARRVANLRDVRVHDLRHTYATRLRAAGVAAEDRKIAPRCSVIHFERCPSTTRAPTLDALWASEIGCSIVSARQRFCASQTADICY